MKRLPLYLSVLAIFLLYLVTLPRGLSWDLGGADGGELAAAVYARGLVHSPGYPTYLMIAQWVHLLPFTPFAIRLNLFSAICAALTAYLLGSLKEQQTDSAWGAFSIIITMLFWGLHELVWSQAIITEVYALASVFCALLLYLTPRSAETATPQRWLLYGFVAGVGLGSHYFTLIIVIWSFLFGLQKKVLKHSGWSIVGGMIGALIFLWLPIRAGVDLQNNWGNPNSLDNFWWVVSGAAYSGRFNPIVNLNQLFALIGLIVRQASIIGVILIVFGITKWWEEQRAWAIASVLVIGLNIWVVAAYNSADILPYLYPSLLLCALAAGAGLTVILQQLNPLLKNKTSTAAFLMVSALAIILIYQTWPLTKQATTEAEQFGTTVIAAAPPNSILITRRETQTFAVRYAAAVNERTDLVLIDIDLLNMQWYQADVLRQLELPILHLPQSPLAMIINAVPPDRPIISTVSQQLPGEWNTLANGLVHQLTR